MGFNFTGIAINKNYQDKIEEVEKILEMKLTFKEEIYFETAMSSHRPVDACDIYFSEDCTIAFLAEPIQPDLNSLSTDRQKVLFIVKARENKSNGCPTLIANRFFHRNHLTK